MKPSTHLKQAVLSIALFTLLVGCSDINKEKGNSQNESISSNKKEGIVADINKDGDTISVEFYVDGSIQWKRKLGYGSPEQPYEVVEYYDNGKVIKESQRDEFHKGDYNVVFHNQDRRITYYPSGKIENIESSNGDTSFFENGVIKFIREKNNSVLEGYEISYYNNSQIESKTAYKNDLREGEDITYFNNGKLKSKETFSNGKRNGTYIEYFENGQLRSKSFSKNGEYEGEVIGFYEDGTLAEKYNCVNGRIEGEKDVYSKKSQLMLKENYSHGNLNGERVEYYEKGSPHFVSNYLDGKKHGVQLEISESGGLYYSKDIYVNGELQIKEKDNKTYSSDGQKCSQCFGHYQGGFCTQCGKASGERVNESYSKAANCEYCGGTGFIKASGIKERTKVCPSCKGKGKQIY